MFTFIEKKKKSNINLQRPCVKHQWNEVMSVSPNTFLKLIFRI